MKNNLKKNKLIISGVDLLKPGLRKKVLRLIKKVYVAADLPDMFLSLHFTSDEEIKALNLQWRGKNKATDVLSFAAQAGEEMPGFDFVLGDVVISVEKAKSQAKQLGHKTHQEIAVLFAHGIMHLLGLDNERDAESAIRQVECEMALLDRADISPLLALTRRELYV